MPDTRTEAQNAVITAEEFDKLDQLTRKAFEIAVDLIKNTRKNEEEGKEEPKNEASD